MNEFLNDALVMYSCLWHWWKSKRKTASSEP